MNTTQSDLSLNAFPAHRSSQGRASVRNFGVAEGEETPTSTPDSSRSARCLIVDDDQIIHILLSSQLADQNFEVKCASSGEEGVRIAEAFRPDLIFMDVEMPGMNGLEAASRIRESHAAGNPMIIAFTGSDAEEIRDLCFNAGIDSFLPKPFNRENVQRVLRQWESCISTSA